MQQAVETSLFKLSVVAGLVFALSLGGVAFAHRHHRTTHRLSLHAPSLPTALYLTAWEQGDVLIRRDDSSLGAMRFTTRASLNDGCEWLATETLVPIDARTYSYTYDETILACDEGAIPFLRTPRSGTVTVDE